MSSSHLPVSYDIHRHPKAKHLRLRVRADASLVVTAPRGVSEERIHRFVDAHASWVAQTLEQMEERRASWVVPSDIAQQSLHACRHRALKFVRERLAHYNAHYGYVYTSVSIKDMSSRWGSCSSEGRMSFHYRLLFLPVALADYVIVHELCHLRELNHSPRFWALVGETMPEYARCRDALTRYTI